MTDLLNLATAPTEPAPALAEVITMHPDGIFIRQEERVTAAGTPVTHYWVERRRGPRASCAVIYDVEELRQLRDAIDRVLP